MARGGPRAGRAGGWAVAARACFHRLCGLARDPSPSTLRRLGCGRHGARIDRRAAVWALALQPAGFEPGSESPAAAARCRGGRASGPGCRSGRSCRASSRGRGGLLPATTLPSSGRRRRAAPSLAPRRRRAESRSAKRVARASRRRTVARRRKVSYFGPGTSWPWRALGLETRKESGSCGPTPAPRVEAQDTRIARRRPLRQD